MHNRFVVFGGGSSRIILVARDDISGSMIVL